MTHMPASVPPPSTNLPAVRAWLARNRRDPVAVRTWATGLLDRAHAVGPVPLAGSPAWVRLPDNDPRKPAAVVLTALAALVESTPEAIAERIAADWAAAQHEAAQRMRETSLAISGATDWGKVAGHVPFCVLAARRTTYATTPLTADQIRQQAAQSWAKRERRAAA